MRQALVIGNWKLNGSKHMARKLITSLRGQLDGILGCEVAIAPPFTYLHLAKQHLRRSRIVLGAQNVDSHLSGAYTGEVSAMMLKDIGAKYIIIGHSERRIYHKENNDLIAKKFALLKASGLTPVLCIGESKEENEAGNSSAACARQLSSILNVMGAKILENSVIAYEPIWAIGTGIAATAAEVQATHKFIRAYIARYDASVAKKVIIQYGGSVTSKNASEFFKQPDVDGVLVGGASLKADDFTMIVKAAAKQKRISN